MKLLACVCLSTLSLARANYVTQYLYRDTRCGSLLRTNKVTCSSSGALGSTSAAMEMRSMCGVSSCTALSISSANNRCYVHSGGSVKFRFVRTSSYSSYSSYSSLNSNSNLNSNSYSYGRGSGSNGVSYSRVSTNNIYGANNNNGISGSASTTGTYYVSPNAAAAGGMSIIAIFCIIAFSPLLCICGGIFCCIQGKKPRSPKMEAWIASCVLLVVGLGIFMWVPFIMDDCYEGGGSQGGGGEVLITTTNNQTMNMGGKVQAQAVPMMGAAMPVQAVAMPIQGPAPVYMQQPVMQQPVMATAMASPMR